MWFIPAIPALIPVVGSAVDFTGSFQPASAVALLGLAVATGIVVTAARRLAPSAVAVRSVVIRPGRPALHVVRGRTPHAHGRFA